MLSIGIRFWENGTVKSANEQTTSKQYDTAGSEEEENMSLAAHAVSKPDFVASSEDKDEMSVALLQ